MNHAELLSMIDAQPLELREALAHTVRRALRVLRTPPPMRLSQWAERHFYLSQESSYIEGRWQCWPPQRAMLDVMGDDDVPMFTSRKSARVGYTKMLIAYLCYAAEHKRRNGVLYQPTDDDRDEFVTTELDPVLRDIRVMRPLMPRWHGRSQHNTLRQKKFTTALLHLRGGKAAKNYRRITADFVGYDELSGFDRDIEKEGSPTKLGDKRLEGAVWPKSIAGSTPKLKHNDNTEDREATADAHMQWQVPCMHCDALHPLTWGGKDKPHGLKWTDGDATTVAHVCPHCGGLMRQADYLHQWHAGLWVERTSGVWIDAHGQWRTPASIDWRVCHLSQHTPADTLAPKPRHVAMPIWTACAPQATWQAIVEEFIAGSKLAERGDFSLLKTWVNTTLGETWEERGEAQDEHELQRRADPYPLRTVPERALALTCGIDVQKDRWECAVWGWGRGMESWAVDHHVIQGNPADPQDWQQVFAFLQRRYPQAWASGMSLPIECTSIDSSDNTQAVYNFVRLCHGTLRVQAIKGSSDEGKPIKGTASPQDVNWRGQTHKGGVRLWVIGVDTAKDLLHGQLQLAPPAPGQHRAGYVHTSADLPREWYEQITAEQRVLVRSQRGEVYRWIKRRPRNEVLDCRNYATHAAYVLDLHRYTDRMWDRLEAAVQPARDLFSPPAPMPAEPPVPPVAAIPIQVAAPAPAAPAPPMAQPDNDKAATAPPQPVQRAVQQSAYLQQIMRQRPRR